LATAASIPDKGNDGRLNVYNRDFASEGDRAVALKPGPREANAQRSLRSPSREKNLPSLYVDCERASARAK